MRNLNVLLMVGATLLSAGLCAQAGDPPAGPTRFGPIAKILEHAKDLGLTPDQIQKLEALRKEIGPAMGGGMEKLREAAQADPKLREELKEARGNPEKMKELFAQIRAKTGGAADPEKAGEKRGEFVAKLAAILTPEQLLKAKEYVAAGGGGKRKGDGPGAKQEKGGEPDRNSAPPKVFE